MMARLMKDDPRDVGTVPESVFRTILDEFMGFDLSGFNYFVSLNQFLT